MQLFQGDIPIIKIEKEDKQVKYTKITSPLVVAEGESTGNRHLLVAEKGSDVEIAKDERGYFLKVNSGQATITHEEHKPITIENGLYFVGEQVEYDELNERRVRD